MPKLPTISATELRDIRTSLELSQEAMGAQMGTTRRTYWQWENEQREGSGTVARLAHLLKKLHDIGIHVEVDKDNPNNISLTDRRS